MKKFVFALAAFAVSSSTFAIVRPGWERPILRAHLTEVKATKPTTQVFYLTMNKLDGKKQPTSLTFTAEQNIMCITAPCPRPQTNSLYRIGSIKKDSCGSTVYYASEVVNHTEPAFIELVDHATRLCEDVRPYRWEVKVQGFRFQRNFVGNPEPVYTIQ